MRNSDRYLAVIVVAIVLLAVATIAVVLLRPEPTYRTGDAPEDVVYNYLLALQKEDFARAYGYLSTGLPGYPKDADAFADTVHDTPWSFGQNASIVTFAVEPVRVTDDRATVIVRDTRAQEGGLFGGDEYSSALDFRLEREADAWVLVSADQYWARCWESDEGCD